MIAGNRNISIIPSVCLEKKPTKQLWKFLKQLHLQEITSNWKLVVKAGIMKIVFVAITAVAFVLQVIPLPLHRSGYSCCFRNE